MRKQHPGKLSSFIPQADLSLRTLHRDSRMASGSFEVGLCKILADAFENIGSTFGEFHENGKFRRNKPSPRRPQTPYNGFNGHIREEKHHFKCYNGDWTDSMSGEEAKGGAKPGKYKNLDIQPVISVFSAALRQIKPSWCETPARGNSFLFQ